MTSVAFTLSFGYWYAQNNPAEVNGSGCSMCDISWHTIMSLQALAMLDIATRVPVYCALPSAILH